ncbi:hypothetical protein [Paenibacillus spongiae]|uniref:Uncharacterized protein n=1 Tax=Paenibacillus spongiae TaxID=2909671 RepID=A0ABY5SAU5_9BACL|nr:hypothetical protein [Paenibacillus spongiae]UVI30779.1 hypothetical protein L1F29_02550 [Paenibacillus spongiae]
MADAFRKIRFKFLYVCAGSALLSSLIMYALYRTGAYVYASADLPGKALYVQLVNGVINHIGRIPAGLLGGGLLFLLFFYYRSAKIKDDVMRLLSQSTIARHGEEPHPQKEES